MHILINDFIGGVLDHGIPLYVRNLTYGLEQGGFHVTVFRAPYVFRKLFYVIAVLTEQFVLPVIGLCSRASITIYPYNTISIIDVFSGRGRIVVHDLEILSRSRFSPSKLYCLGCYAILKRLAYPVFTIAGIIQEKITDRRVFGQCPVTVLPNTFYVFEDLLQTETSELVGNKSILLCTGSTENKDLASVVSDYLPLALREGFRVSILGLHKTSDAAMLKSLDSFMALGQLRLCGKLSDRDVVHEYKAHEIVWVHSLREGFGRCVVEGRLAGRCVVCSAIPEFVALRDEGVYLYESPTQFADLLTGLARAPGKTPRYTAYPYRDMLRDAIRRGL